MRILVTGSTGFVGGALCRALVAQGHELVAFHRPASLLKLLDGLPVEHAIGDLTQPETLMPAMRGVEVVFHAAAQLGAGDAARFNAVTVAGTRAVLDAARAAGVRRLVHTSSVAALGVPDALPAAEGCSPALLDERHTWNYPPTRWRYGYAKYLAELEVQQAVAAGLDVVIVNPSVVLGAGDIYRTDSSVVMQVARGRLKVAAPGGINVVHIDDVISGHLAALERGATGERYILGGENIDIPRFLVLIAETAGVPAPRLTLPAWATRALGSVLRGADWLHLPISGDTLELVGKYFYYDTHKARAVLGLSEPKSAQTMIADTLDWFQKQAA